MIRLLVVDDHPVVREGLVAVLNDQADLTVVGAAGSAEEAVRLAADAQPDVVLLDLELPGLQGVEAIPRLARASPEARVLVFTAYDTEGRVVGALRAGARGYLLKGAPSAEIAQAIRTVHAGGTALAPRVAAQLVAAPGAGREAALTGREREVLRLAAEGLASKQIAQRLGIAERTVKFHLAGAFRKLDADNRAQAVAVATQRGLL